MQHFDVSRAADLLTDLRLRANAASSHDLGDLATVDDESRPELHAALRKVAEVAQRAFLYETLGMVNRLIVEFSGDVLYRNQACAGLHHLHGLMKSEMQKKLFFVIDPTKQKYFKEFSFKPNVFSPGLPTSHFGRQVDEAFPTAHSNILEAGNALIFEMNNAAAYHLMRVAEVGLRVLAWDRRVVPKYKGDAIPLELAEWGKLIAGTENKVQLIHKWRRNLVREEAHQFYNRLLVEIRAFNDGWRRHIAHNRSHNFEDDEAIALWGHVARFMETLATKMSEKERTPAIWKTVLVEQSC